MANQRRAPFPNKGTVGRKGRIDFTHTMVIGATGAISSQDADSGVSASRVSAGLYTLTFPAAYKKIIARKRSVRIYESDEWGSPCFMVKFKKKNGKWEHHLLSVMEEDTNWVPVKKNKK